MLLDFDDDGPGPVVVLLHGFPLDRSMWVNQRATVGAIYRLITPDLRGHGTSAAPEGDYAVDTMADDVIETLDKLGLASPVVIGGHSMGGYVALSIAARHPGRVKGLILMNTRAGVDSKEAAEARKDLAGQVESSGDVGPVVASMLPKLFAKANFEAQPGLVSGVERRMLKTPARAVAGTLRGLAVRPDRAADLPGIRVPALVLAGVDDAIVPVEDAEAMARSLPEARLVRVAGAGHLAPLENPAATDAAILEFLDAGR